LTFFLGSGSASDSLSSLSSEVASDDSSPGAGVARSIRGGAWSGSGEDERDEEEDASEAFETARERFLSECLTVWAGTEAARGAKGSARSEPVSEIIELAIVKLGIAREGGDQYARDDAAKVKPKGRGVLTL